MGKFLSEKDMVFLLLLFISFSHGLLCVGEENPNCGSTTTAQNPINCQQCVPNGGGGCSEQPFTEPADDAACASQCSVKWHDTNDCSKYDIAVKCNIVGCNCDNCDWTANNFVINTGGALGSQRCQYICNCACTTGPIANKGQDAVTAPAYLAGTVQARRETVSARMCVGSALVSWEFLQNIEAVMDVDKDGMITPEEFDNAREVGHLVYAPLGCPPQPFISEIFPNLGQESQCEDEQVARAVRHERRAMRLGARIQNAEKRTQELLNSVSKKASAFAPHSPAVKRQAELRKDKK